ncbi:acyl-CoA dehydrogenase family protein [Mycobacterium interjectum]|uniref:acyl-CoA dehydrogenase family protein n=1 Tax=Mycobacterium interjectum TaxID=33895 RepID=UPI000AEAFDDD
MDVRPSAERREFASMLRALLAAESTVGLVRGLHEPDADRTTPALWKALSDAGIFGLAIAEQYGGFGGSLEGLAVFFTEACGALGLSRVFFSTRSV